MRRSYGRHSVLGFAGTFHGFEYRWLTETRLHGDSHQVTTGQGQWCWVVSNSGSCKGFDIVSSITEQKHCTEVWWRLSCFSLVGFFAALKACCWFVMSVLLLCVGNVLYQSVYWNPLFWSAAHTSSVVVYLCNIERERFLCLWCILLWVWWLRLFSGDVASDWEFAMQLPLFSSSLWSCLFSFCKWWLLWCSIHQDSIDLHKNCLHLKWLAYILPFYEGISTHCATTWSKTSKNERNFLISARISFVLS